MINKLYFYQKTFKAIALFSIISVAMLSGYKSVAQLPPHFQDQTINATMNRVEGVVFDNNKRMYAWEKKGLVWIIDSNGVKRTTPLINISQEVGSWVDHGLNGVALDPDFANNGYIYLNYTVDRHYLLYYGTPTYNKDSNEYNNATITRLTRYTCDKTHAFNTIVAGSRLVLIGETKQTGIPDLHLSHSACNIIFGTDGTLIVPTGDGAAYGTIDNGSNPLTYWAQALIDSIITPDQNVGAFRSQKLTCMNGKLLRIDPLTGDGVPSNPYYDAAHPRSAQSRTYCLGLRNPFSISLKPGTGSTNPADGNPGVFYIGDVGFLTWEELDVADQSKLNFGWPLFEGLDFHPDFKVALTPNYDAPNPLYGTGNCTQQFFNFQDLLKQATLDTTDTFKNSCDTLQTVPSTIPTYYNTRPIIEYRHNYDSAQVGIFNGTQAALISIGDSLSPCQGVPFGGDCIIGGVYYNGTAFPPDYQNKFYFGEFEDGWIRKLSLDSNNVPFKVDAFAENRGALVHVMQDAYDGSLIYVRYEKEIHKICYACLPDSPPVAIATADTLYGIDSLHVQFNGSQSYDVDNAPLTYSWNFGDGNTSALINPQHTFTTPPGVFAVFTVVLSVTDDSSHTATDTLIINLNNTPPAVQITSCLDSDFYSVSTPTNLPLTANVVDAEQTTGNLFFQWQVIINTNGIDSLLTVDTNKISSYTLQPLGCGADTVYYKIILTVTDSGGLQGRDENHLYPDCNAPATNFGWTNNTICASDSVYFVDSTAHFPDSWQWTFTDGNPTSSTLQAPVVFYANGVQHDVTLTTTNSMGNSTILKTVTVNNLPVVNLGNDTAICANATLTLDAGNAAATYLWNDGNTTSTLTVATAGVYAVTVTDTNTCKNVDTVMVSINQLPVITITPIADTVCVLSPAITLTATPVGGVFNGNGVTGTIFNPDASTLGTNTITYSYTDAAGCTNSDSVHIWVDQCVGIAQNNASAFTIYPNPAHDKLYIENKINTTNLKITITDLSGAVQLQKLFAQPKHTEVIDCKDFAKGFYIIQVAYAGYTYFSKVIIQ